MKTSFSCVVNHDTPVRNKSFSSSVAIRIGNQNHFAELLQVIDIFEVYERVRDAYDLYSSLLEKYPGVSTLTLHTCFVDKYTNT